uniref:Reverse transcriptase domain-containing protein n=1 Tax=Tanacetum cinerariifolium TaxID=118510 RepID=A0A6L2L5I2_TANCI|nr:reverse transcriptase domain-containing protein [Tanacetum cinerariifolium]
MHKGLKLQEREQEKRVKKDQTAKKQKGGKLEQDNAEKQKMEEQKEAGELKKNLEIVPDDEDDVFVNVTPLSSKPPTIVDYKIYKEGKKENFQIIRAYGNHQMYLTFSTMLKNFDREDFKVYGRLSKTVSVVSVKSYCCQFKLMLLEEGLLLLEDLMLLIQETTEEIKITAIRKLWINDDDDDVLGVLSLELSMIECGYDVVCNGAVKVPLRECDNDLDTRLKEKPWIDDDDDVLGVLSLELSDYQVLHLYLADKPKDNTLMGSVPGQDAAARGIWGVFSLRDWHGFGGEGNKKRQKSEQNRTKSRSNGKHGKARQTSSLRLARDQSSKQKVENPKLEEHLPPVDTMTDNRTMAEMLCAPTEGYAEVIVVPPILAEQFELKHSLINMMTSEQFFGLKKDNPHDHIRCLRNEISNFEQKFGESFHEAWDRYKDLLRACPHHGFTELHQLNTFYNALNPTDQDSLNVAAGGNLLERSTQDVLTIIENKSKVLNSRSKSIASQVKVCDTTSSSEISKLTHAVNEQTSAMTTAMMVMLKQFQATPPPAPVKAVEETCVTCEDAHPYYQCPAVGGNTFLEFRDNIQGYVSAAAGNYNQGNPGYRPQCVANQMRPPAQPNPNFHLNELEKIKRMNDVSMKAMQNQIDMVKNKLRNEMKTSIQTSLSNQTNEIKNMMASLLQMNTPSTSGSGSLPINTVTNPKGKLKAITTRSGLVTDGPTVPTPPKSITPEVGECVEETYGDLDLAEYTIKVPPPPVQKYKPPSQRDFVVHKRDPLHPNIPYPSRMLKQKQQEKYEVQIQKFWQMFKQLYLNITLAEALVLMPKYQKMLKALLSNKEKFQELANTPLNENCLALILKKLPKKLRDPGKFLIPCGFSELKCKALADLGASINLMPLSVWKELGLPKLIPTDMTLELAKCAICTPAGIARDVFVPVGKFTFTADFVVVDYESDPRVPLIMGRPFLRTARALIDVHDFLEVSVSNKPSGNPTFSLHQELTSLEVNHDIHDSEGCNDIHPHSDDDPLSGSTTYLANSLLEEFTDELALITYPSDYDDNLQFDIESDLKGIEFLLYQGKDTSLKDSIDQMDLANLDDYFVDPTPEMFTDEHAPDYSSPPIFDVYDDDFLEVESDGDNVYDDPVDFKGEKIKESKLLIDELDLPYDFLPYFEYDLFNSQDFYRVDALPSTNNEDKVFNPGILIHEKPVKIITRVAQEKKLAISNASFVLEDFDPPFCEPLVFKDVPKSKMLLPFSSENEEKVFKPGIYTAEKKEHSSLGCSSVPFLSSLISSSMGEFGPAHRPKTSASWEAPHAYQ